MINIRQVYVCIGTSVSLKEQEEIDIVIKGISASRSQSNALDQMFDFIFTKQIMIERSVALLPFALRDELPEETRKIFFTNKPEFDPEINPNYTMTIDFLKEGKTLPAAVLFLFD